jgi:membrane fusion protein (multidrug efflux system)
VTKRKLILGVVAVAVLGGFVALVASRMQDAKQAGKAGAVAPAAPRVHAARVTRADVAQRVAVTGTIRARSEVEVHPEATGRIATLHAKVGDRVRAGQVLAVIDHDELAWQAKAADAALAVARANHEGAKLEWARTEELRTGGAIAPAQVDGAKVKLALAEAQVAQAAAAAGLAHEGVANARVVTPIAGTVTRRLVDVGAQVDPGKVVFTVHDLSALKLVTAVEAADWARLGKGSAATVFVDALPGETFAAKVTLLAPALDPATRRAEVELEVENSALGTGRGGRLIPGLFARAELAAGGVKDAIVVPRQAVVEGPGGAVVWRVRDGKAEALRPRLGAGDGKHVVVIEGLAEGDVVVTNGQGSLVHGGAAEVVLEDALQAAAPQAR